MKHKMQYKLIVSDETIYIGDDLEYFNKLAKEMEYRRTGRTTRLLFRALSDPSPHICIEGWSNHRAKILYNQMKDMLTKLDFEFTHNDTQLNITNFGKTYYFRGDMFKMNVPYNASTYVDEK